MDYADAGVDEEQTEDVIAALTSHFDTADDAYAGLVEFGDSVLGMATDGVGTKLLVADAVGDYSTIGIDCVAMNVNDILAMNLTPAGFVNYFAVEDLAPEQADQIGEGLKRGVDEAGIPMMGGETAVMPDVITDMDLAGTCLGTADPDEVIDGSAVEAGDVVYGLPSNGVHSNGYTLARKAITQEYEYDDTHPDLPADTTIGEELLTPTRIYSEISDIAEEYDVHGMAHITGGGYTNLERVADYQFIIDDPQPTQLIFDIIQETGNVQEDEMYRTFNMGTGFACILSEDETAALAQDDRFDGGVIGYVGDGSGVSIDGMKL